jgi:hypothetical protein
MTMLLAVVPLAANLLTTFGYQYQIQFHYSGLIVVALVAATIIGISHVGSRDGRQAAVALVWASAAFTTWMWSPAAYARHPQTKFDLQAQSVRDTDAVLAAIPKGARVSAFYAYVPHLTHRREIYEFPNPWIARNWGDGSEGGKELPQAKRIDYIAVPNGREGEEDQLLRTLTASGEFRLARQQGGALLYRRVDPAK